MMESQLATYFSSLEKQDRSQKKQVSELRGRTFGSRSDLNVGLPIHSSEVCIPFPKIMPVKLMARRESRDVTALLLLHQQISVYLHLKFLLLKLCGMQHYPPIRSLIHDENVTLFAPIGMIILKNKKKIKQSTSATILNTLSEVRLPCLP